MDFNRFTEKLQEGMRSAQGIASKRGQQQIDVEHLLHFNRVTRPGWRFNGQILKRRSFSRFQLRIFDALVPLWRRVDGFFPWPAVSVIAVGRVPGGSEFTKKS